MDPNPISCTAIDATDSTVSSLASSFVQHEINSHSTTGGPINSLPNELMQMIMVKLALDDDVKKLVQLRLVSTRWNSHVQHYCQMKKSLLVNCERFSNSGLKNYAPCVIVRLKTFKFLGTMLKLFPNIEQLAVSFRASEDNTPVGAFSVYINSLNSLKRLELNDAALQALPHLSKTLSRLEHIGLFANYDYYDILNADDFLLFVSNLGPNCVRVFIGEGLNCSKVSLAYDNIVQCLNIKPNFFANLTHLQMCIPRESDRVVHLLAKHATLLEFLNFQTGNGDFLVMSPSLLRDLGRLVHLTELKICCAQMDIGQLDEAAAQLGLTSLTSVLTCDLIVSIGRSLGGDKFTRVLSVIFPKLTSLNLNILYLPVSLEANQQFMLDIEQNLHLFANLRKHDIDLFSL